MKLSDLKVGMVVESQLNKIYTIEGVGKTWVVAKDASTHFFTKCSEGVLHWAVREVKPKVKRWINIYPNKYLNMTVGAFATKQEADSASVSNRIACIKIEFTEGEGLDK